MTTSIQGMPTQFSFLEIQSKYTKVCWYKPIVFNSAQLATMPYRVLEHCPVNIHVQDT